MVDEGSLVSGIETSKKNSFVQRGCVLKTSPKGFDEASLYVAKHAAPYLKEVVQEHAPIDAMDHPTLAEKILGMDDEALQKLLGVMVGEKLGDQEMEEIAKE